ncbi:MAG: BPSS1780 family membrane protein [Burkholderiaceae bacterium]
MQVLSHPSSRGLTWLTAGIRIMGRQPVALLMLVFIQLLLIILPAISLKFIGAGITAALIPVLYVGLMTAIRATERGEDPNPMMLFTTFQPEANGIWKPLMLLGLISGLLTLVAYSIAQWVMPMPDVSGIAEQVSGEEYMQLAMAKIYPSMLATLFSVPIQMAFWFAPMLVAWHGQSIGQSIFYSWMAVVRNLGAFTMLFLGWLGVILVVNIALTLITGLLGIPLSLLTVMLAPVLLVILTGAYCSFWVTYRDVIN